MSSKEFDAVMAQMASQGAVDSVNWPAEFSYCPKCSFRIARSTKYLAVSFDVEGQDLRATQMGDNGRSWEDSCCEFFVSTKEGFYYNIEITCIGSILIGYGSGRSGRLHLPEKTVARVLRYSSLEHKCYDFEGGNYKWSVSVLIPFDVIGLDYGKLPETLKGNFYKCGDLTAHPHFTSWNPISTPHPDFHRPEFFGELKF